MASAASSLVTVAIAGALTLPRAALMPRSVLCLAPKSPCGLRVGVPASTAQRATAATSRSANGASSSTVTGITDPMPTAGSIPWKVQWQLQGTVDDGNLSSGDSSNQNESAQQPLQLQWTAFDRGESVRIAAQEASGWDPASFEARYTDLSAVLPDLPSVLPSLQPCQLLGAMSDLHLTASKVVMLKEALPSTNVGMLLLLHPAFLDPACTPDRLLAGVEHAARVLGGYEVAEEVLQWYPPLLDPAVLDASVAQLKRLVPQLARNCLPAAGSCDRGRGGMEARQRGAIGMHAGSGGGDARQLVHLLGIVMQKEGGGVKSDDEGGGSMWWGCS